ncbi:hypothetical protein DUNSADRAFT_13887 [Dunaliella salina]|uniref:HSA domain-containing protein n=1 Tax=Dunaliella salina TaxID=3046 RepID=A0ABQ7H310_DUNSA|nr:hypothetical protein DUNSADRAFT_13887 [Dunaliella salina]|eukprot:KAF5841242.1 hypothetical protein DUNSADRAFT_13887 [Dunaliella salina]
MLVEDVMSRLILVVLHAFICWRIFAPLRAVTCCHVLATLGEDVMCRLILVVLHAVIRWRILVLLHPVTCCHVLATLGEHVMCRLILVVLHAVICWRILVLLHAVTCCHVLLSCWAYREWVLAQGKVANRNRQKQNQLVCPEPKRIKSHWDHVLEEMEWLAKDFQRERKDRLSKAKRLANTISKSNLGIEARQVVRERQEQEAIRKKAKFIAQQSGTFWAKAQRVVEKAFVCARRLKLKGFTCMELALFSCDGQEGELTAG